VKDYKRKEVDLRPGRKRERKRRRKKGE